jgi:hypothetical protein
MGRREGIMGSHTNTTLGAILTKILSNRGLRGDVRPGIHSLAEQAGLDSQKLLSRVGNARVVYLCRLEPLIGALGLTPTGQAELALAYTFDR